MKVLVYWVLLRFFPRQSNPHSRVLLRLMLVGVLFLFGGEAFCILGPMRYERIVHISCHALFYAGVAFGCLAAMIHWTTKRRR